MNSTDGAHQIIKAAQAHGFEYHVCGGFTRGHLDLCHIGGGLFEVYNESTDEAFTATLDEICENFAVAADRDRALI